MIEFYIPGKKYYTDEEILFIQKRAQETSLEDDKAQMLFYKQIDKVNKYKIFHKEIFSLKTNKKDGQCF